MSDALPVRCVVPISGGKDSQLCLKLAVKEFGAASVRGLFCDTQFEHPTTYAHVSVIGAMYGVQIDRITAGSVPEKVRKYGRFPGGGARHCTDELKIRPTVRYLKALATQQGGFQVWYGMRTAESPERASRYVDSISSEVIPPHEFMPGKYPKYLFKLGVVVRLPIVDFPTSSVFSALGSDPISPLYKHFDRVGCFPCLAAGDETKERAFGFDEFGASQKVIVLQLEKDTGKSVWTSSGGLMRNHPDQMCMLCQQ